MNSAIKRTRRDAFTASQSAQGRYQQVIPGRPEQVWVADITWLPVREGETYLSLVTGAWSRKIVGHCVHDNLKPDLLSRAPDEVHRAP